MFWPCETRTSTCRSFATISSGLYRFLAIAVLLDVKDIPQVGPLQWGWIIGIGATDFTEPVSPTDAVVETHVVPDHYDGRAEERHSPKRPSLAPAGGARKAPASCLDALAYTHLTNGRAKSSLT